MIRRPRWPRTQTTSSTSAPASKTLWPRPRPTPPSSSRSPCCPNRGVRSTNRNRLRPWRADLAAIPATASAIIESEAAIASVVEPFKDAHACAVLARGFNRATAFEWALKLQEMTYVLAHPYSTADFRHGPIAVVESGFPVFAVATRGRVGSEIMELLGELRSNRDAATLAITDSPESPGRLHDSGTAGAGMGEPDHDGRRRPALFVPPRGCAGRGSRSAAWPQQGDPHAVDS